MLDRIIKTTITIGQAERVFLSAGGRDGKYSYMRQDFYIKSNVNIGAGGLHTAEIKLFNLNEASAKEIESEGSLIRLEAGYEGKTGLLFEGRVSSVTRTKLAVQEPDIITTLYCVSGLAQMQRSSFSEAIVRQDLKTFLNRLATKVGLVANIDSDVTGEIINRTFDSDIKFILSELGSEFGFNYYWNERSLFIRKIRTEITVVKTYRPEDGILDIPVITERGVDLKVFLDSNIRNGDGFQLDSQFANFDIGGLNFIDRIRGFEVKNSNRQINNNRYQGVFQVLELEHSGSSHDDTWETTIKSKGVRSEQVLKNKLRVDNT